MPATLPRPVLNMAASACLVAMANDHFEWGYSLGAKLALTIAVCLLAVCMPRLIEAKRLVDEAKAEGSLPQGTKLEGIDMLLARRRARLEAEEKAVD